VSERGGRSTSPNPNTQQQQQQQQSLDAWLASSGDGCLRAFATGCLWLGGAHALYLAALPGSSGGGAGGGGVDGGLRGLAARRSAPRARRLAVAGVMVVAAYDALRSGQQDRRRRELDERFAEALAPTTAAPL
jgi:hypothetical protein